MPWGIGKLVCHDFVDVMLETVGTIGLLNTINFHSVIAFTLTLTLTLDLFFLELFIFTATALSLKILTSFIRLLACGCGSFALNTNHFGILDHSIRSSLTTLLDLFFLFLGFFGSVLISISSQIGLRLLRWEFRRCRCFGIPVDGKLADDSL